MCVTCRWSPDADTFGILSLVSSSLTVSVSRAGKMAFRLVANTSALSVGYSAMSGDACCPFRRLSWSVSSMAIRLSVEAIRAIRRTEACSLLQDATCRDPIRLNRCRRNDSIRSHVGSLRSVSIDSELMTGPRQRQRQRHSIFPRRTIARVAESQTLCFSDCLRAVQSVRLLRRRIASLWFYF